MQSAILFSAGFIEMQVEFARCQALRGGIGIEQVVHRKYCVNAAEGASHGLEMPVACGKSGARREDTQEQRCGIGK